MNEANHAEPQAYQAVDPVSLIASLRAEAADRFDPVGFRYLEALARRAPAHRDDVRRILDGRLGEALSAYRERFERARDDAAARIRRVSVQDPEAADDLQRLHDAGDFSGIRRRVAVLEEQGEPRASLAELTRHIAQHSAQDPDGSPDGNIGARAELKSIRYFRGTWSKLSADRQVRQAIEQGPENAGPLNSHMLVLRSLALMREISPDYLNRFVSYVDALLWLDQADRKNRPTPRRAQAAKSTRARG